MSLTLAEYYKLPCPTDSFSMYLKNIFELIIPSLRSKDPTYGRSSVPEFPPLTEMRLNKAYSIQDKELKIKFAGVESTISYNIIVPREVKIKATLVWAHGLNDTSNKFMTEHSPQFLEAGYRVISFDLPSHGRSSGIHVHIPNLDILPHAAYSVIQEVYRSDSALGIPHSKYIIGGQSLGGWLATRVCINYGSLSPTIGEPFIAGGLILCPMLGISAATMPHPILVGLGKVVARVLPSLPVISGVKGNVSEDPLCEEIFRKDPLTYHGFVRSATANDILRVIAEIGKDLGKMVIPFSVFHGTGDRATSHSGSEKLFKEAASKDKEIKLYEKYEHILLRKGVDEVDDKRRQVVILDMLEWLKKHE